MASTSRYPDNSRTEWVIEDLVIPIRLADGWVQFAYAVYASQLSKDVKDLPFLYNSHRSMIRTNHARIVRVVSGAALHISGAEVMPDDMDDFVKNDRAAYRWVRKSDAEWEDDRGRVLPPWMFLSYWGVMEGLDPQWQRETFTLPQNQQVEKLLTDYLRSVEVRRLSGDHRGTTLDLQVSASADDAIKNDAPAFDNTNSTDRFGQQGGEVGDNVNRYLNVTVPQGATIDVAYQTYTPFNTRSSTTVLSNLLLEDVDDAAQVTDATDYDGRSLTAPVAWDSVPTFTDGVEINTPSLVTPIQTVINRAGWASGQAMQVFHHDDGSVDNVLRDPSSYDFSTSEAAKLHLEYTAGIAPLRRRIEGH